MTSWDFWSVVCLLGIFQAILLLVYFVTNRKSHVLPTFFVAAVLIWIIWLQAEFLVLRRAFMISDSIFFGSRHGIWFLLGPLLYHYTRSLFRNEGDVRPGMILHYLPFLIFTVIIPLSVHETIPERVINYGMLSVLKFPMLAHNWVNKAYGYIFILQFVHAAVYLVLTGLQVTVFKRECRESTSDNRQEALSYLKAVVAAISLFTISSVMFIGILLNSQWYVRELDYVYIVPLTFCVYLLSFFAHRQPLSLQQTANPPKYLRSNLGKEMSLKYFEKLDGLIRTEKLYLNPELRLGDLAEMTGIGHHQLSEVINKEAGVSFFEFINLFRIKEVLATIEIQRSQNRKINILEIAFAAGFNNKASFNRYFKKVTGQTPSEFIKIDRQKSKSL